MTHFVRFAMVGVMVAGASVCALTQDADLDALLGDLIVEEPAETPSPEEDLDLAEPGVIEEEVAEEELPAEEEAAEETEAEAGADEMTDEAETAEDEPEAADEVAAEEEAEPEAAEEETEAEADAEEMTDAAETAEDEPEAADEAAAEEETEPEAAEEEADVEVAGESIDEAIDMEEPAGVAEEEPAEELPAPEAEPEVEPEAAAEPAPEAEPEVEPEAAAEPVPEAEPEPEMAPPSADPEPASAEDEVDIDDILNGLDDMVPETGKTPDPIPEPVAPTNGLADMQDEPAPEAAAEPAPEAAAEPEPEMAPPSADPEPASAEDEGDVDGILNDMLSEMGMTPDSIPEPVAPANGLVDMQDDSAALQKQTQEDVALNDLEELIRLKNKGLDAHAQACLARARSLMDPANPPPPGKSFAQYAEAIRLYGDAQKYFREREGNLRFKEECERGMREARYRQAKSLFADKQYKDALELAQQVQREGHPQGANLVSLIQEERNRPPEIRPNPELPVYATDDYKRQRLEVQDRLRRATNFYRVARYKDANDQLELILREDPSNEAAINLRARIDRRMSARNRELKYSTHNEMINQVEATWTPLGALGRYSEELYNPVVSRGAEVKVDDKGQKETEAIMAKLQYIRLPEFNIRPPSTLADAVQTFAELSRAYDRPELPPEEKGVSFVLNMGAKQAAASSESSEEEDPFGSGASESDSGLPPIQNISMTFVTLKEALDMVCDVTGSKYVIKGKAVVIVPATYVEGEMETRSYNVMSTFDDKVSQVRSDISSDSGSDWASSDSGSDMGGGSTSESWKKLFIDLGVPFEGQASLVYLKTIGKLRVTNTPENLARFERVLEELNVTPYQIEVEARFVEVSQTDLNSLGFEWQLNSDIVGTVGSGIDWASSAIKGNPSGGTAAGGIGAGGNHIFRPSGADGTGKANLGMHGGSFNNGMRFLGDGSVYANRVNLGNSSVAPDDTFASFSAVFGRVDMTVILHMLAQRSDTDMLSSPKVVARSGMEAMIKVVTEWIYPTEFDITELEEADTNYDNNNTSVTGGGVNVQAPPVKFAVEPQSFETKDVGVSLNVMPEVSQEGQMINLSVNPKVVEYLGDFEYGMQVPYIQYSMTGGIVTGAEVQYYRVSMPQPKFHVRELSTYLSVYNGATVVMGGLITETRKSFEDKIPLLGDLPFIGFLFRSTGEYSEKRNLLIFLTARLVDPAGRPLKTATDGRTGASAMDSGSTETMSSIVK